MAASLFILPLFGGLIAFFLRRKSVLHCWLPAIAVLHLLATSYLWPAQSEIVINEWLSLDPLGKIFLGIISLLFLTSSVVIVHLLRNTDHHYSAAHQAVFIGSLLLFLGAMTLVTLSRHLGLLWASLEATTLAGLPLIIFHRHSRSLEAAWKYIMICSVGVALALLGNFFLGMAMSTSTGGHSLIMPNMLKHAHGMMVPWLKAAFIFFLTGYGTKMGLAPMHTWLPDAHSEAPSAVSALLSGALLNCAFLGILRARQILIAAGLESFCNGSIIFLGLLSMFLAGVFITGQTDYKRMLAYSSVEHMGILAFGLGLGGSGAYAMLFHALNHSLSKGFLFLTAGITLENYRTKNIREITGLKRSLPMTGFLWLAGFLAVTGSPPFGTFFSEMLIIKAAFDSGRPYSAALFLLFIFAVMAAMTLPIFGMIYGKPDKSHAGRHFRESLPELVPALFLAFCAAVLGLSMPGFIRNALTSAAALLGG